jgi:hypothetical protein
MEYSIASPELAPDEKRNAAKIFGFDEESVCQAESYEPLVT